MLLFGARLEENIFSLHNDLISGRYTHGSYQSFYVKDPKLRHIHKPRVRDRIVHHALVSALTSFFEPIFIHDSYSSRENKGTHRAVKRFRKYAWKLSQNDTRTVWVLQCDIRRFFDSINHKILFTLLGRYVEDEKILLLLEEVIESFETHPGCGIPLGNLTSQLFSNVYMNPFDHFVKETLHGKYYLRYADDFLVVSRDKSYLLSLIPEMRVFLKENLSLSLHPRKVTLKRWNQGIDFLGYISFPHHAILRPKTKRRILRVIRGKVGEYKRGEIMEEELNQSVQSYKGLLQHCRGRNVEREINSLLLNSSH